MKVKFNIKNEVELPPAILEEKINTYLKKNYYRVIERGPEFVIFINDEYSERKRFRSDFHTRIGEGKFEYHATNQGTFVKLIYFTDVTYPIFLMMLFLAFGIYTNVIIMPIIISFALTLPVGFKIYYLNEHVFNEILER